MSADFWAGYISGAIGILIGNPLDLIKVRLQAGSFSPSTSRTNPFPSSPILASTSLAASSTYLSQFNTLSTLLRGSSAPILGYGALNALLFVTYNRSTSFLTRGSLTPPASPTSPDQPTLLTAFVAGALGGLATWVISTPTELVKCRAQVSSSSSLAPASSYQIAKTIIRTHGIKGLYFGGIVTSLRDSIGYGFYFWTYEATTRSMSPYLSKGAGNEEAAKVLLCGGLAGVATWASIFPLDVIKTRVQTQVGLFDPVHRSDPTARSALLGNLEQGRRTLGAVEITKQAYRTDGMGVFFKGLGICSLRAFVVNAAQWAVYEWIMRELNPRRTKDGIDG